MTERFHQPLMAAIYRDLPILAAIKRLDDEAVFALRGRQMWLRKPRPFLGIPRDIRLVRKAKLYVTIRAYPTRLPVTPVTDNFTITK
jgi:hypothetical protein